MLRKLLPRGKMIVLLRDTVERAYVDLVRTIAAEKTGAAAEESLMLLVHGCMRTVACEHPSAGEVGVDVAAWTSKGADKFKKCVKGAASAHALEDVATSLASAADVSECVADTAGPTGVLNWNLAFGDFALKNKPLACAAVLKAGASDALQASSPLGAEAAGWLRSSVRQVERRVLVGCLPPSAFGRDPPADIAAVTQDEVLAALRDAADAIAPCTTTVDAGVSLPVPVDLMAGVVAGYDLNLVGVSADMPKSAALAGSVLVDGEDACFPGGAEGFGANSAAHALARSMYLRPLQRLQASYGRDVVSVMDSTTLKSRPLSVVDPILTDLNVYKPTVRRAPKKRRVCRKPPHTSLPSPLPPMRAPRCSLSRPR